MNDERIEMASARKDARILIYSHDTFGLGEDVPMATGNLNDGLIALKDGKMIVLRVPYPLGFYAKGLDGVIAAESKICDIDGDKGLLSYRGYTIEVEIHDGPYNNIKNWDYAGLIEVFNAEDGKGLGLRATTAGELSKAIEQALANHEGPTLIECALEREDTDAHHGLGASLRPTSPAARGELDVER